MAVLGLILMVACGAVGAAFLLNKAHALDASVIGIGTLHYTVAGLFLVGALTGLLFTLGLGLFFSGLARSRRRSKQRRQLARTSREGESLREENTRLSAQLEQTQASRPAEDTPVYPHDGTTGARPTASGEQAAPGRGLFRK